MLVCIDKLTCARMLVCIQTRWQTRLAQIEGLALLKAAELSAAVDPDTRERLTATLARLRAQADWMAETRIAIVISEAQNEVRDFKRRDTADLTELLKALHGIVNEAVRAAQPAPGEGDGQTQGLTMDLSLIDFARLRAEFAQKVRRKHAALQNIRDLVEKKLAQMLARNPTRMDYYKRYQEIIADYNREKDRTTVEATFSELVELAATLDLADRRAAAEGLSEDELALFDLLFTDDLSGVNRERLKQASRTLLAALRDLLRPIADWTQKAATQAAVKIFILDDLYRSLPRPTFTETQTEEAAARVYEYIWQRSAHGLALLAA